MQGTRRRTGAQIWRSRRASSLIQVIIVAGIFGFLSVSMADLLVSAMRAQRGIEVRDATRDLEQDLVRFLSEAGNCQRALKTLKPGAEGQEISDIPKSDGSFFLKVGEPQKNGLLIVESMRVHSFVTNSSSQTGIGMAKLSFVVRASGEVVGPKNLTRELQLSAQLDLDGKIQGCFAVGGSGDRLWLTSTEASQGIYSVATRVGIGTIAKNAMFEVSGGVKIGDDTEPCSANKLGVLRVSATMKTLELCDGVNWVSAGGTGASPPQCSGIGAYLQFDGGNFKCFQQTLIGGKSAEDCSRINGVVHDTGAGMICKVSVTSRNFVWDPVNLKNTQAGLSQPCPTGWSTFGDWRATEDRTCTYSTPYDGQLNCTPAGNRGCGPGMYGCNARSLTPDIRVTGRAFSAHAVPRALLQTYGQTCGSACGSEHCRDITFFCDAIVTHVGCI
jgi:hypothetical protein